METVEIIDDLVKLDKIAFGDGWTIENFVETAAPIEITPTIRAAYKVILILVDSIVNQRHLMPVDVAYIVSMNIPYDANDNNHVDVAVSVTTIAQTILQLLEGYDLARIKGMIYFQKQDIYHTLFLMSDSTDSIPFREIQKAEIGPDQQEQESLAPMELQELKDTYKNLKLKLVDMYNINVESAMNAHNLRVSPMQQSSEFKQYVR